jgi:signal transduction histidine kinase
VGLDRERVFWPPAALMVLGGTVAYVAAVYGAIVIGGGLLSGTSGPSLPLAVLATAVVAVSIERVRRALADRLAPSAESLLADLAQHLSGPRPVEELGPLMARLLAEGTSARRVEVWLERPPRVGGPALIGRWPAAAEPIRVDRPTVYEHRIVSGDDRLGLILRDCPNGRGTASGTANPLEERLLGDLLAAAALALRPLALTDVLQDRIAETEARAGELLAARRRLVASADAARQRLERDVHDGAQQQLLALALNLSHAATVTGRDPERAAALVDQLRSAARSALATLEDLSRGIYPATLTESGIGPALRAATSTSPVPVRVRDGTAGRLPAELEAAAYFACLEAVQNALKHARARLVDVHLGGTRETLWFEVCDDGIGFDAATAGDGAGLGHLRDRLDGLGGSVTVCSRAGQGTSVSARLPVLRPHNAEIDGASS